MCSPTTSWCISFISSHCSSALTTPLGHSASSQPQLWLPTALASFISLSRPPALGQSSLIFLYHRQSLPPSVIPRLISPTAVTMSVTTTFSVQRQRIPQLALYLVIVCLPLLIRGAAEVAEVKVVGTTGTVALPEGHLSTPSKTCYAQINDLWCGAESLGVHIASEYGEFTRLRDGKVFTGTVNNGKVFMEIGKAPANVAGSYRCEIRTLDKKLYNGLLEVYVPPVLIFEKNTKAAEIPESSPPLIEGESIEVLEGETLLLECPVFSHPKANVVWQKDGKAIAPTDIITYDETNLFINGTSSWDSGVYRCIADNSFPSALDGPTVTHTLHYALNVTVLSVSDDQLSKEIKPNNDSNIVQIL